MRKRLRTFRDAAAGLSSFTIALVLATGSSAGGTPPQTSKPPLACVPAARDDPEPWTWNSRILASFQPEAPKPEFIGAFGDDRSGHELHLWRNSESVFGELLGPVLEADSPTSRLYDPLLDAKAGTLSFTVRFKDGEHRFTGQLRPDSVTGSMQTAERRHQVTWRRLAANRRHGAVSDAYVSRAQFECAMTLFRRY